MALLQIQNLKKTYTAPDGSVLQVVDLPHFELDRGVQVGLRGRSGCGKTTLLNLIAGIVRPDSGVVRVDDDEVTSMTEGQRDRFRGNSIGYVFQTFNLLQAFTCLENVLLGMKFAGGIDHDFAIQLLERVGLSDRLHYRPSQLSTGQQQRVAVARALANRPKLVLADEPTGNLDPISGQESLGLIRELCRENKAALLLTSHEESVLSDLDRVQDLALPAHSNGGAE